MIGVTEKRVDKMEWVVSIWMWMEGDGKEE